MLVFTAKNNSDVDVNNYKIEVEFPLTFLNLSTIFVSEVRDRRTNSHMFFRHTEEAHNNRILYSGDNRDILSIEYFIRGTHSEQEMQLPIRIKFNAGSFPKQVKEISISEVMRN